MSTARMMMTMMMRLAMSKQPACLLVATTHYYQHVVFIKLSKNYVVPHWTFVVRHLGFLTLDLELFCNYSVEVLTSSLELFCCLKQVLTLLTFIVFVRSLESPSTKTKTKLAHLYFYTNFLLSYEIRNQLETLTEEV